MVDIGKRRGDTAIGKNSPDSGKGAEIEGCRFNYEGTPVLYLCTTERCSEAERCKSITKERYNAVAAKTTGEFPDHGLFSPGSAHPIGFGRRKTAQSMTGKGRWCYCLPSTIGVDELNIPFPVV